VSTAPVTPPPGWYADPNGAPTLRWWNGAVWADQYLAPTVPGGRASLPATTPVNTPWIWVIVFIPLLSYVPFFFWDFSPLMSGQPDSSALSNFFAVYFAIIALSLVLYAANVVASYFDWRELERRGVARPFHWAWGFIPSWPVYLIGRTVVVHQVSRRGLGPIWGYAAMWVGSFVIMMIWTVWFMQVALQSIPFESYGSYS
jgi:hypothetical protein